MKPHNSKTNNSDNHVAFVIRRIPHYRALFYKKFVEQNGHLNITVFHGTPEKVSGGSGLIHNEDYPFARKLRAFKAWTCIFQRDLIKNGLINRYPLVIFEGSVRLVSSFLILIIRKFLGKKNILWLKGWPDETEEISKIRYLIKKCFLSMANAYIVYGNESITSLLMYGIDPARITVAQNTVDVDDILSKKYVNAYSGINDEHVKRILTDQTPYIYNIGRIIKEKKVGDLIEAFRQINNNSIQLLIAGDGPDVDELKEKVNNLNLTNVHLLGAISEEASKMLYANCVFCVFPGLVGLSLNEAMAAGKAIICADEKGPDAELLSHNDNGLRFEKGNIRQLAGLMNDLIQDKENREKMGQKAFETIHQKATMDNMVQQFSKAVNNFYEKKT